MPSFLSPLRYTLPGTEVSHRWPVYPAGQSQNALFPINRHVPPLKQGLGWHWFVTNQTTTKSFNTSSVPLSTTSYLVRKFRIVDPCIQLGSHRKHCLQSIDMFHHWNMDLADIDSQLGTHRDRLSCLHCSLLSGTPYLVRRFRIVDPCIRLDSHRKHCLQSIDMFHHWNMDLADIDSQLGTHRDRLSCLHCSLLSGTPYLVRRFRIVDPCIRLDSHKMHCFQSIDMFHHWSKDLADIDL